METGTTIFLLLIGIIILIWLEWVIGKAIGNRVSHGAGMVLGIIGILFGFTIIAGIACIIYSQKNRSGATIGINLNTNTHQDDTFASSNQNSSITDNETRTCPYCAETIKKKAIVCRFCGRELGEA